jgi:hypothetical protein
MMDRILSFVIILKMIYEVIRINKLLIKRDASSSVLHFLDGLAMCRTLRYEREASTGNQNMSPSSSYQPHI